MLGPLPIHNFNMTSAPLELSLQGHQSSPEGADIDGAHLAKRADINTSNIVSWLEDLQKHRLSQQGEIDKQRQELETIKSTHPTGPLHEQQLRRQLVQKEQQIEELESAVHRGATLLEATWSRYEMLRRQSVAAQDQFNVLQNQMQSKDALIATDSSVVDLVPDLLDHFANKKAKKRQTVQISDARVQRVKLLLERRPIQYGNATSAVIGPADRNTEVRDEAQFASADAGPEPSTNTNDKGKEKELEVMVDTATETVNATAGSRLDWDSHQHDVDNHGDASTTPASSYADMEGKPYRISLYTLDPASLSSPEFDPRTCQPHLQDSRILSTSKVQDGEQVLAVVLKMDKEMKLGIRKYDMFFKLENLDLHTIASYDLVEPGDEDRFLKPWTRRVAEEGVCGRGEELRELKIYAFPEEKTLEAMGAILMCHET